MKSLSDITASGFASDASAFAGGGGSGDVVGPASATDLAAARFDGTTGKLLQDSRLIVDDNGNVGLGSAPTVYPGFCTVTAGGTLYGGVKGQFIIKTAAGEIVAYMGSGGSAGSVNALSADGTKYISILTGNFYNNILEFFGADLLIDGYGTGAVNGEIGRFTMAGQFLLGTSTAGGSSLLKAAGQIESTTGGFKFPDASVQTTAATTESIQDVIGAMVAAAGGSYDDGAGTITLPSGDGSGNVVGPASATDNALARYDGTTGKLLQNSPVTVDDNGNISITYATVAHAGTGIGNWYGTLALWSSSTLVATVAPTAWNFADTVALQWNSDTGLSRTAAGKLALGNGTAGSFTGELKLTTLTFADGNTMTAADLAKLDGVATGATANSADASLLDRANHTGTQTAATISDFTEASQDVIGAMVAAAGGSYNDGAGTITLPGGGGAPGGSSGELQ